MSYKKTCMKCKYHCILYIPSSYSLKVLPLSLSYSIAQRNKKLHHMSPCITSNENHGKGSSKAGNYERENFLTSWLTTCTSFNFFSNPSQIIIIKVLLRACAMKEKNFAIKVSNFISIQT